MVPRACTKSHISGNACKTRRPRKGAALLVVLFIVMAITILSLAFITRSDVELACGQNMQLEAQMRYTAESGLEHARGLILSPQEIASEYWDGAAGQQIIAGDYYYDVNVVRDDSNAVDRCNYIIDCNSYRVVNSEKIGRMDFRARLRLDPCIACWLGASTAISSRTTINGDVYCAGNLANAGFISGDVFAAGTASGTSIGGSTSESVVEAPVVWPCVEVGTFYPTYYIGVTGYSADVVSSYYHPAGSFEPSAGNPGGVRYRDSLELQGDVNIEGTLVVNGDLQITGSNNVITATKNFPAIMVGGNLNLYSGSLEVNGLVVVDGAVRITAEDVKLKVIGGLFAGQQIIELAKDTSGNSYHAELHNGPVWRPTGGAEAGALEFDGVDDYVKTPDSPTQLQLTGDYTISLWVKPDATQKAWAGILSKCDTTGTVNHWTLVFDGSASRKVILYYPHYLPEPQSWDTGIRLSDLAGAWRHVGIIRSGNSITSYVDGVPRNTSTWDNSPGSGNGHLNIGSDPTTAPDYVYKGLIDGVRVYGGALDPNDLYPPVSGLPDLMGLWQLDGQGSDITVTAAPCKTAIMVWSAGVPKKWQQAGAAFFRSIARR